MTEEEKLYQEAARLKDIIRKRVDRLHKVEQETGFRAQALTTIKENSKKYDAFDPNTGKVISNLRVDETGKKRTAEDLKRIIKQEQDWLALPTSSLDDSRVARLRRDATTIRELGGKIPQLRSVLSDLPDSSFQKDRKKMTNDDRLQEAKDLKKYERKHKTIIESVDKFWEVIGKMKDNDTTASMVEDVNMYSSTFENVMKTVFNNKRLTAEQIFQMILEQAQKQEEAARKKAEERTKKALMRSGGRLPDDIEGPTAGGRFR